MAVLLKCPDCRKPIAQDSQTCPLCGEALSDGWVTDEIAHQQLVKKINRQLLIILILLIVGGYLIFGG